MKFAVFGFIFLVSTAATCVLHGWLESSVNMIEGLRQLFAPGATTVVFSPFPLLFIALGLGVFIGVSLLAVSAAAVLGSALLRSRAPIVSLSFVRFFVIGAMICQFAFILFASAPFLLGRPRLHPNTYLVAFAAAVNAALNLSVAALVVRKLSDKISPLP